MIQIISLFCVIWFTPVILIRSFRGQEIPAYMFMCMAMAWVAFVHSMGWLV